VRRRADATRTGDPLPGTGSHPAPDPRSRHHRAGPLIMHQALTGRRARLTELIQLRHDVFWAARADLRRYGFLEIDTPTFQRNKGGGTSTPFRVHVGGAFCAAVAPHDLLKYVVAAGIVERAFELRHRLRPDAADWEHEPEYSVLEMCFFTSGTRSATVFVDRLGRRMLHAARRHFPHRARALKRLIGQPWPVVAMQQLLAVSLRIPAAVLFDRSGLVRRTERLSIPLPGADGVGPLQQQLFEHAVRPRLRTPVFVRYARLYPSFELFMPGGTEVCNMFEVQEAKGPGACFAAVIGVDRLLQAAAGRTPIQGVIPFPWDR